MTMTIAPGTYRLGPEEGTLSVRTGRTGAIARAGHDLLIEVEGWGATVQVGSVPEETVIELNVDPNSLSVREGTGGMKALDNDDRANINQTIVDEVLKRTTIAFRSMSVSGDGRQLHVQGDLELFGGVNPVEFGLELDDDGHVSGQATLKQTAWGVKPYTALFGTLKVADEVQVLIDGQLAAAQATA